VVGVDRPGTGAHCPDRSVTGGRRHLRPEPVGYGTGGRNGRHRVEARGSAVSA
jgi:hypothetical protein